MAQQLAGETGSQSYGEDGRAFGVEVDGIRLVIVGGQHGRVQWNKRFYTGASRSKGAGSSPRDPAAPVAPPGRGG